MIVYGIKNCDSVKKALKYFKEHHIAYEFIDFKTTPVSKKKISTWLQYQDIDKLFNSRSTTYRNLKLKELDLDEASKIEWMSKENLLIKRPIIEFGNKVVVGVNFDEYDKILT
jgi:Spx/MgsR family transcriptional regulator